MILYDVLVQITNLVHHQRLVYFLNHGHMELGLLNKLRVETLIGHV